MRLRYEERTDGVMSVKEARKLLGTDAQALSDEEIRKILDDLDFLAQMAIRKFKSEKIHPPRANSR